MINQFNVLFLILRIDAHPLSCQFADYSVSFICTITANFETVSLIDNHGKDIAICELSGTSGNCSSNDLVQPVIGENEVKFYVHRNRTTGLNGNWFCSHENKLFRPEVSTLKDKTASTIVNLFGKIVRDDDIQRLLLTCSSCRIPKGNHAEFLINDNSVDSVRYNNATGKCMYSYGQCSIGECNCSSVGNAFSRFFVLKKQLNTETYFSCDMRFHIEDQEQLVVFSKVSTLSFNGKEFKDRGTRTVIIKLTDIHNRPKDKNSDTAKILIPVISASVIMVTILTVALYCNLKGRKWEKKKRTESDESFRLCAFEKPAHKGESTDDEDSFISCHDISTTNLYNNSDTVSNIDMKDQTVQVNPKELTSPDMKDQIVQVNPKELTSPDMKDQTVQVNPKELTSPDIDERIFSKLTEDSKSHMKREPYHGNIKLDVIFMNCDSFTKKWVYRVAVVLEEDFHLRCGISGFDNDSFKYVTETSKIILPFSRNSEKIPDTLELNEYIPIIVVVMIELCSIPSQFPNMKCVDATKNLHVWFPKLLAALKVNS